mmetsp:Transcript_8386/g.11311  ORF Transcript_8386/g.11311 Transcript_8386/m.11311 type:complete len:604 (-) Transcript_8386:44-1855(-)
MGSPIFNFKDKKARFEEMSKPLLDDRSPGSVTSRSSQGSLKSGIKKGEGSRSQLHLDGQDVEVQTEWEDEKNDKDMAPGSHLVEEAEEEPSPGGLLCSASEISTLSHFNVLRFAVLIGVGSGLFTAVYTAALNHLIKSLWRKLPHSLFLLGWTQSSPLPHQWYILFAACLLSLLTGLLASSLSPHGNVNMFIDEIHKNGRAPTSWILPMIAVSLLSVASGCSVGPEGAMIVVGGNVAGALGARLRYPKHIVRWFSLVGSSACVSAFFGMPFAGSLFVITMLNKIGDMEYYEALKGSMLASIVCVAVSDPITSLLNFAPTFVWPGPDEQAEEDSMAPWMFPTPAAGEVSLPSALITGALCGVVGAAVAGVFFVGDRYTLKAAQKLGWPRWLSMLCGGLVFGMVGALRPGVLFWSEHQIPYALGSQHNLDYLSARLSKHSIAASAEVLRVNMPAWDIMLQGIVKAFLAGFCKSLLFPGGIIYPMIFAGGAVGTALRVWATAASPHLISTMMPAAVAAGAQSAVNKTPWASTLLVLGTHAGGASLTTFVAVVASVIVADSLTRGFLNSFYFQRPRESFEHPTQESCPDEVAKLSSIAIFGSSFKSF